MISPLTCKITGHGSGDTVLTVAGEIDLGNVDAFLRALESATRGAAADGSAVSVDLRAVDYLDSAAISALCQHAQLIRLIVSPVLASILSVSGVDELTAVDVVPRARAL